MIVQVSYFIRLKRLLEITHLFQLSRLLYRQWRSIPAVAMASLIIHAYKRRSAQNADAAQTTVGVTHVRSIKNEKIDTYPLYAHHRHICAWPKNMIICMSLFCRSQTLTFMECDPGPHKTMKYRIRVFVDVRKYASGACINHVTAFH